MADFLWLIPVLPLAGFAVIGLFGGWFSERVIAGIGVVSVALSGLVALAATLVYLLTPPEGGAMVNVLWQWIGVGGFSPSFTLRFDALSLVMVDVVTGVGFLIHLYSVTFMGGEAGYRRYFAYMNLFVFGMLTLVLAGNLLLLYLGWEMVGLCSYLLIGYGYAEPANGRAARKAFVVTRTGDAAMLVGLVLLFTSLGTLDISTLMGQARASWGVGEPLAVVAAALLLAGAVGKSAQLPLQVWLPDAMAGPTPVSALIHAATMVTAGVYLIARTHVLFELAPAVQTIVAVIGAATLLLAAFSALTQRDIKRVLAYSTISQIGYMVLALGVGAYAAGMFHFMTHAFFKALLFLAAGVVIVALDDEHDIFRMGGLRRRLPGTTLAFVIGAASLAAVPAITAGFYSKDLILWAAYASPRGGWVLWLAGELGALLTGIYIFRVVFVAFGGPPVAAVARGPRWPETVALVALAVLSVIGGFVYLPPAWSDFQPFGELLHRTLPAMAHREGLALSETLSMTLSAALSLTGIAIAWLLYGRRRESGAPAATGIQRFWREGWGFDWVYLHALTQPFMAIARTNRHDVIDGFFTGLAQATDWLHGQLSATQTGRLRWYAAGIAGGAAILVGITVLP